MAGGTSFVLAIFIQVMSWDISSIHLSLGLTHQLLKFVGQTLCKLAYAHQISIEQYFNVCIINVGHIQLDQNQHCINNEDLHQLKRKSRTDI